MLPFFLRVKPLFLNILYFRQDLVVDVITQLKRTGDTRGKRLWYNKKKELHKDILASLQVEQEIDDFSWAKIPSEKIIYVYKS